MLVRMILASLVALLLLSGACTQGPDDSSQTPPAELSILTKETLEKMALTGLEKQLVDKLVTLWLDRSNIASVMQAADMLDLSVDDSIRIDLIETLRANPNLSPRLQAYGPYTIVLTNGEKRLGQYIVRYQKEHQEFPPLDSILEATGFEEDYVTDRLKFFTRIGFLFDLDGPTEYNALGYSFGDRMADVINNTGLHYHTFTVSGQKPFNVCCAKEAFYKLLGQFSDKNVHYETFDPLSTQVIVVVFDDGKIKSVTPEGVQFLEGGYCVANCLLTSKENATTYVSSLPFVQNHQVYDPRQRLESLRQELEKAQSGN